MIVIYCYWQWQGPPQNTTTVYYHWGAHLVGYIKDLSDDRSVCHVISSLMAPALHKCKLFAKRQVLSDYWISRWKWIWSCSYLVPAMPTGKENETLIQPLVDDNKFQYTYYLTYYSAQCVHYGELRCHGKQWGLIRGALYQVVLNMIECSKCKEW